MWHVPAHRENREGRTGVILAEKQDQEATFPIVQKDVAIEEESPLPPISMPAEMVAQYTHVCPRGHGNVLSYHPVSTMDEVEKICPTCNAKGFKTRRLVKMTFKSEFDIEFVLVRNPASTASLEARDGRVRLPVSPREERAVVREPVQVRRKVPVFGSTLIVKTMLDGADLEVKDMFIVRYYLRRHGMRVAWHDQSDDPVQMWDASPFEAEFEYHPHKDAKK